MGLQAHIKRAEHSHYGNVVGNVVGNVAIGYWTL